MNPNRFFQFESKFEVGERYETLRVKRPPLTLNSDRPPLDEEGVIIEGTTKFLGVYVRSVNFGCGDGRSRYDYFTNDAGQEIVHTLEYDGSTRYRKV